jgi:hypothetical protein
MIFPNQKIIEQLYLCLFFILLRLNLIDIGLNKVVLSCLHNRCTGVRLVWFVGVYYQWEAIGIIYPKQNTNLRKINLLLLNNRFM